MDAYEMLKISEVHTYMQISRENQLIHEEDSLLNNKDADNGIGLQMKLAGLACTKCYYYSNSTSFPAFFKTFLFVLLV